MQSTKRAAVTALCIALASVLPLLFHMVGLGAAFSPMHLPIFLCGLLCGPGYGLFCGLAGPLVSSLTTGMPAAAQLGWFFPELGAYGFLAGLLYRRIRTGARLSDLLLSLLPAMLLGRILGGAARAVFTQGYGLPLWVSGYLLGTLPGAALQLLLLPALLLALEKAHLTEKRYPYEKNAVSSSHADSSPEPHDSARRGG